MVSLKGTNQEFGRPYNRRIVLEAIRLHGPVERAEIARRVGLTVQTVANITHELEAQGFIKGSRSEPRGRGSPATSLAINPSGAHAIGVHVTPRGLEAALVDLAGSIIAREHRALERPGPDQTMTETSSHGRAKRTHRPALTASRQRVSSHTRTLSAVMTEGSKWLICRRRLSGP